jgi:alpha-L-rhamnosidase
MSKSSFTLVQLWACLSLPAAAQAPLQVADLRTEYKTNPVGIDVVAPRLSWKIESSRRGTVQTAYQVRVAKQSGALQRNPLWDSGKVPSDASIHRV